MLSRFRCSPSSARGRPVRTILQLQPLEERTTPATFTVTNLNDPGAGSFRQAILDANATPGPDDVVFQQGLAGTIALTMGEVAITDSVNIRGPGAAAITINGNNLSRLFNVGSATATLNVSISGLTLRQGNGGAGVNGGAILSNGTNLTLDGLAVTNNAAGGSGGALAQVGGALTVSNSTFTNNNATVQGGGIFATGGTLNLTTSSVENNTATTGGGLALVNHTATIVRSTVAANTTNNPTASAGGGGLLLDNANARLTNSTVSGNSATGAGNPSGGGIFIRNGGSVLLQVTTVTGNSAAGPGGGLFLGGGGAGPTSATLQSAIVANSTDAAGSTDIGRVDGNQLFFASDSLIESPGPAPVDPAARNLVGRDPVLGPLTNNGGPTRTHALLAGSPAIDTGGTATPTGGVDQRGLPRPVGTALDIGAFEVQLTPAPPTPPALLPPAAFNPNLVPPRAVAVGTAPGDARVFVFDAAGGVLFNIAPFPPGFRGGARAALADVNGDGVPDIIVGAARGNAQVRVLDGITGGLLTAFAALDRMPREGVYVAGGDVNGDGRAEVLIGAGRGEQPLVEVWNGNTGRRLARFFNGDPRSRSGVTVAAADVTGDGIGDIITGSASGSSVVTVRAGGTFVPVQVYFAYAPNFRPGIIVTAGDVNGDGRADIVVGTGRGGPPLVRIFDGLTTASLRDFLAFFPAPGGGVLVAVSDLDGNGRPEVVAGSTLGLISVVDVTSLREILRLGPFGGLPF